MEGRTSRYLTQFIGRKREVEDIHRLLADRRLLTITGAGGTGKTRLAVEVALGLQEDFPDGIWFIELAELTEAALVPQMIASSLGIREVPDQSLLETLTRFLRERRALLLLDNCEHLLNACARLTAALLQDCPDLHLLATSREALGLPGEMVRPMLPLDLPASTSDLNELSQVESVALFVDRAAALLPNFSLTKENASSITRICRLLDGIPLALELAAARVPVLSVSQIASRLEDSLRLLVSGPRLGAPRHQTMRAAIDWSYALLSEEEQTLWRRLSVFRGGFSIDAVEEVCGQTDPLELLTQLINKSLVVILRGEGEMHYRLLEPLRQYAAERLEETGQANTIRQNHCGYYLAWAEENETKLRGAGQPEWLKQFDIRYSNLRAALAWSLRESSSVETGLRLAVALGPYWYLRNMLTEGRRWLEEPLAQSESETPRVVRGQAFFFASVLAWLQGDILSARTHAEESHATALSLEYEGQWGIAHALMMLGQVVRFQGEEQIALGYLNDSIALFRRLDDRWGLALTLDSLGSVYRQVGDLRAAYNVLHESRTLWRMIGDPWGMALNQLELFQQAVVAGDDRTVMSLYEENKTTFESLGYTWHLLVMHEILGDMALRRGDYAAAEEQYRHALSLAWQIGNQAREAALCIGLGAAALGQGNPMEAVTQSKEGLLRLEGLGRFQTAGSCLERFVSVGERLGYAESTVPLQEAAEALLSASSTVDASPIFAAALSALQGLNNPHRDSGKPAPPAFGLTPRELEILRLAAEGLTDPQIAERLVVSKRTVGAHLSAIYQKMGVNTRTAAARVAVEHRLFEINE